MSCLPVSHSEELVLSRGVRDSSEGPSPPNMANVCLPPEGFWVLEPWVSPAPESAKADLSIKNSYHLGAVLERVLPVALEGLGSRPPLLCKPLPLPKP